MFTVIWHTDHAFAQRNFEYIDEASQFIETLEAIDVAYYSLTYIKVD